MNDAAPGYGPTAIATPANALTAARLLAAPVFVGLIMGEGATWTTVAVGVAVAGTDGVDGWLARRQGATRSGAFLDPLADKFVVLGAFFALAAQSRIPWAPVALITAREVGMSAYRSWAGRRGVSVPARPLAKVKTVVQELAIASCLVPPLTDQRSLQLAAVWTATALTIASGAQYVWDGRRAFRPAKAAAPGAGAPAGSAPTSAPATAGSARASAPPPPASAPRSPAPAAVPASAPATVAGPTGPDPGPPAAASSA